MRHTGTICWHRKKPAQARANKLKHSDGALIDVFVEEGASPATNEQLDALDEDGEVAMDTA